MMKKTGIVGMIVCAFVLVSAANLAGADPLAKPSSVFVQEVAPAVVPRELAPATIPQELTPALVPQELAPAVVSQGQEQAVQGTVLMAPPVVQGAPATPYQPYPVTAGCAACGCHECCCPPPRPVPMTFCLVEPTCGCSYEVCVEVPPCCLGQQPVVQWRNGVLGRKIANLCWPCCDKRVKVVITAFNKVRVRD